MAFWKIYFAEDDAPTFNSKDEIGLVNGEKEVYNFLMGLPDVGSARDSKSYGYTNWWTFSRTTHRALNRYIAMQYTPTQKELETLRPKKTYKALPKRTIGIKKGDIFGTSWGYDQTQYDFVIITSVSPTGKTVMAKMVTIKTGENIGSHDVITPNKRGYGDEFRLQVRESTNDEGVTHYGLVGQYPFIDGKMSTSTRSDGFSKYDSSRQYSQTNVYHQR